MISTKRPQVDMTRSHSHSGTLRSTPLDRRVPVRPTFLHCENDMLFRNNIRSWALWLGLLSLMCGSGCAAIPGSREFIRRTAIKPSTGDYDDGTDEVDEEWVRKAGIEARGDRPLEHDNDPFRNLLMSPKARSIERNLGFD